MTPPSRAPHLYTTHAPHAPHTTPHIQYTHTHTHTAHAPLHHAIPYHATHGTMHKVHTPHLRATLRTHRTTSHRATPTTTQMPTAHRTRLHQPENHRAYGIGPGYVQGRTKLTPSHSHDVSHNLAGSGSCVRPVRALSILDGAWKSSQRAHQRRLAMGSFPKRAEPRKRSTPTVPRSLESTPTWSTARPGPTNLLQSFTIQLYVTSGYAHRASCLSCQVSGILGG